jgi:hypothetical protein
VSRRSQEDGSGLSSDGGILARDLDSLESSVCRRKTQGLGRPSGICVAGSRNHGGELPLGIVGDWIGKGDPGMPNSRFP